MIFKKGDKVVSTRISEDTDAGVTGTIKRASNAGYVIIERDDGYGWTDGKGTGWSMREDCLCLLSEHTDYEIDA